MNKNQLERRVFYVFTPAIVGSKLADTITAARLVKMWFMPINILLTFLIGSALGWILIKLTKPPKHLRALILGVSFSVKLKEFMLSVKVNFQRLLSPSTCGAIVRLIIGLIPQIRKTVIGDSTPLHVIQDLADLAAYVL
ncbi:hypothetical protein GIB67_032332 [Kingdonia uniflora]|uniref:Uncharacterized protein n=1 Tax=Kingdonia uniflora TaxID=39325 RepID=A0A7J7MX89_9MAGN|nr:hypothetical protein GIB67_032332 [Kingdonia uniflora]